jgi:hypothetical protein
VAKEVVWRNPVPGLIGSSGWCGVGSGLVRDTPEELRASRRRPDRERPIPGTLTDRWDVVEVASVEPDLGAAYVAKADLKAVWGALRVEFC